MDLFTPFLFALGLSADAFAVSVTDGICSSRIKRSNALATALTFGLFQGIMPLLGYIIGNRFSAVICRYQYWVSLILLCAIGINMIVEVIKDSKNKDNIKCTTKNIFSAKYLILQGIATSIDALAAGVSMVAMDLNIIIASTIICIVTFLVCFLGVYIGKRFGNILGLRARLVGGIILILIGFRIFFD